MTDTRTIAANEDPVCGMEVDIDVARNKGQTLTHDGREYASCGKGCMLDFRDDPEHYLDREYAPSM